MGEPTDRRELPWTHGQRRAILLLLTGVFVYLLVRAARHRQFVPDPMPPAGPLAGRLADRIDPNTADVTTLAALPGMGDRRAAAIVSYRERARRLDPAAPAFAAPIDLLKVRGVGVAMASNLMPYLTFPVPATAPATRPGR